MAFWGAEVKSDAPYIQRYNPEIVGKAPRRRRRLRITEATLVPRLHVWKTPSTVSCTVGTNKPIFLCALSSESCQLDVELEETEDDITFTLKGPRTVHLAGYFLKSSHHHHISDSKGNHFQEIKSDHPSDHFTPKYDGCIINQTFSADRPRQSGVIIEELDDERDIGVKCDKKYMENNVDALQLQVVKESKNEDEEKFIVKNAELEEQSDKERAVGGHEENTNRQLVCFKRKIDDIMQDGNREWSGNWQCDSSIPLTEVGNGDGYIGKLKKKKKERVKGQLTIPREGSSNDQTQTIGESNNDMYKEDENSRNIDVVVVGDDQKEVLPNTDKNIIKNTIGDEQEEKLINDDERGDWRLSMPLTEVGAEYVKKLRKKRRERVMEQLAIPGEECSNNQTQAMGESNNDMYKEDEYSRNINLDTIGGDQKDTLPNNDKRGVQLCHYLMSSTGIGTGDRTLKKKKKKQLRMLKLGSVNDKSHAIDSESRIRKGAEYPRNINKNAIDDEQDEKLLNDDEGGDRPSGYLMPSTRVDNGDNGMPKKKKKKERVKEKLRILEHGSHQNHAIDDSEGGSCKGAEYPRRADQINFSLMPSIEIGVGDKRNMKKKKRERIRGEIKNPEEAPSNDKNQALCLSKSDICIKDDYPRNKSVDHRCDSSARLDEVIVGDGQKLKKKNRVKKLVVPEGELINVEVTSDNKRDIYKEDEYLRKVNTDVDYVITEDYAKVKKKKIVKEKRKIKARGCERNAITGESTLAVEVDRDFVSEIEDILRPIRCYGES